MAILAVLVLGKHILNGISAEPVALKNYELILAEKCVQSSLLVAYVWNFEEIRPDNSRVKKNRGSRERGYVHHLETVTKRNNHWTYLIVSIIVKFNSFTLVAIDQNGWSPVFLYSGHSRDLVTEAQLGDSYTTL